MPKWPEKDALTRRELLKKGLTVAAGGAIFGMGACRKGTSEKSQPSRVLNLYTWRFYTGKETIPAFEKEFSCKVNIDYYASNDELLSKLRTSKGQYDIVIPSDYMIRTLIDEALIQKIEITKFRNLHHIDAELFLNKEWDPHNEYSAPYMWGSTGFARNRAKVEPHITSWEKMLQSQFGGHIGVLDDIRFTLGSVLLYLGLDANTQVLKELDDAKRFLINHKKLIRAFTQDSPKESLISGDLWLAYAWSGDVLQATFENPTLQYELPEGRTLFFQDGMCIPTRAPHLDLAYQFIDYILRPDVSAEITNTIMYGNPNKTARQLISPAVLNNLAVFPPEDYIRNSQHIKPVGKFMTEYEHAWNEVKNS